MNSAIFWGEKKETSRISPSSLLSPTSCCWYLLWMWPSPVQIPSWPLSEWVLGQSITGSSSSKVAGSFFGVAPYGQGCVGVWGGLPLSPLAGCRPVAGHVVMLTAALGPCLHPSVLTSVGLLSLLLQVFCRNGLQSMFSMKNFPFWLYFLMKAVF